MHVAVYGYHLAAAGRVVLFGVAIGGVGCASSIPQAPEGVIFLEHRSFLWKGIKTGPRRLMSGACRT